MRRARAADPGLGRRLVRALSVAGSDEAASAVVLAEVARKLDSPLGVLWLFDVTTGLLHWGQDWADGDEVDAFRHVARRLTFAPGVGLPGRVLESGETAWIEDVAADANFPRAEMALKTGLRSAVAGPLAVPEGITGVIEFFGRGLKVPAAEQLDDVARSSGHILRAARSRTACRPARS
jgi:hypothetical protein